MQLGLEGSCALVTGGSKGIGKETARLLAYEGCDVAIVGRGEEQLRKTAEEIGNETGREVVPLQGDMTSPEDVDGVVNDALARFGQLDILITSAGSSPGGLVEDLTEEEWLGSLNLKFMGYVRACRSVLAHMRERRAGSIVLIVGNDGAKPSYWEVTAGVANAADCNFASAMAEQYGPYGIRVNTVNPGPVRTDRLLMLEDHFARDMGGSRETVDELFSHSIPLGRICEPSEVADVAVFLASNRASFVNGNHVLVDGAQRKALLAPASW